MKELIAMRDRVAEVIDKLERDEVCLVDENGDIFETLPEHIACKLADMYRGIFDMLDVEIENHKQPKTDRP